jgi:predicted nuclease of restriction endonuclease-like (RecB) superfamily
LAASNAVKNFQSLSIPRIEIRWNVQSAKARMSDRFLKADAILQAQQAAKEAAAAAEAVEAAAAVIKDNKRTIGAELPIVLFV